MSVNHRNAAIAALISAAVIGACTPAGAPTAPSGGQTAAGKFKIERKAIYPGEFAPGKPYSPGVLVGDTLYIAGQVSKDPKSGEQPAAIEEQTQLALANMGHVLRAAGMDPGNVVSCHVYLADMENYQAMNAVYGKYFEPGGSYPARTTLEVPGVPGGSGLEISCIAYADKSRISVVTPPEGAVPAAMGPYSKAVWAGDTLYVSGSGGRDPKTNEVPDSIEEQTKNTLDTIGAILDAASLKHENAVFVNAYYLGPENYAKLNSVYKDYFEFGTAPARASFCLSRLPGTISVEITFIATRDLTTKGRVLPHYMKPSPTSSPATLAGDTMYLSAKSSPQPGGDFESQMRGSLQLLRDSLLLGGMDYENVVSAHVYLKDLADMPRLDAIFSEVFGQYPPARTTIRVREEGPREAVVEEVALIAVR
jgi:2-iminobutanoate/2-iminopropanoate deaminase